MDWREDFHESLLDEEALNYLIQFGGLEAKVAGITALVRDKGLHCLSEKQLWLFKTYVVDEWLVQKCQRCQLEPAGHELIGFWENAPYCGLCAHRMAKDAI
jgi:hypothetical protein